jgi:hypothetical protein
MDKYFFLLLFIILFFSILFLLKQKSYESFSNKNDNYLYPIKGLQSICEKDNLKPSFMPKICYVNGVLNSYANCKCEDEKGNCKICYDKIIKDSKNSNVIYNAKDFS